ncbi:ABC transporter substrate-binding protein [Cohnella suwonensis]|uniref:ABC transporter substrate-binding protein n=1 Tax=Cohnella suwonensis TaxID=696072 RepID=A0ABW0LN09_9BACL
MTRSVWLSVCLMIALLTGCSAGIEYDPVQTPIPGMAAAAREEVGPSGDDIRHPTGKVSVWSYYAGAEWIVPVIQAEYPDLKVEVITVPWDNYEENYLTAIDHGNAPDVLLVDNNMLGKLVSLNIFEDLSAAPYNGEPLARRFTASTISPFRSLTDNRLFALPLDVGPGVAYYRRDLFLKAGLPADPEELGRFMEDPNNWLRAALKLKQQGSWIASSDWDPIWMTEYASGFFDRSLDYARDTSSFAAAIDLARNIRKNGLASGLDPYSEAGRAALNDGKTAMFFNGWWYGNNLKTVAPDTSGLWRMMRLPLGLYGWAGSSGTAISASSRNKPGAWAVVNTLAKHIADVAGNSALKGTTTAPGDPYYGGQQTQTLYADLVRHMPPFTPTPLDDKAKKIWAQFVGSALDSDRDPNETLDYIRQLTMDSLQSDLDLLKAEQISPPSS